MPRLRPLVPHTSHFTPRAMSSSLTNGYNVTLNTELLSKERITILGSGNWGSAIARIAGRNTLENPTRFYPEVTMWVYEEEYNGQPLSHVINTTHTNPRYLPGIQLGSNVRAEPNLTEALKNATALVVVLPHQFLPPLLNEMQGKVKAGARAVTLIKGVDVQGSKISTFASVIQSALGISCSALSGANIATEVACDLFSESTLGVSSSSTSLEEASEAQLWKTLFQTPTFRIRVVADVEGVSLCGALKNIVALAAGFIDGLGWGANAKAAIMRIGLLEIHDFCLEFFETTKSATFTQESCGIADIITSCVAGRNRQIAQEMVKTGKSFQELEKSLLNGQKLQGPWTANEIHNFLLARLAAGGIKRAEGYPLFDAVWKICFQNMDPSKLTQHL